MDLIEATMLSLQNKLQENKKLKKEELLSGNEAGICPNCHTPITDYGDIEWFDEYIGQDFTCQNCGKKGMEYWKIAWDSIEVDVDETDLSENKKLHENKRKKFENVKDIVNKIKDEPRTENYEKGLKLKDEIVNAWKNNDLETAYAKWEELHDLFSTGYDDEGNATEEWSEEQAYRDFYELTSITDAIEDKCVYDVTDYGKRKAYKSMGYDY